MVPLAIVDMFLLLLLLGLLIGLRKANGAIADRPRTDLTLNLRGPQKG